MASIMSAAAQVPVFQQTYGGWNDEFGYAVDQCTDDGFIIIGSTVTFGAGAKDFYLVKTDGNGIMEWSKTYGGGNFDEAYAGQQTTDGGYIMAGYTFSYGQGLSDVYLVKTDANGDTMWTRAYGGTDYEEAYAVQQTTDGGYIVAGQTRSFGAGEDDVYLLKIDGNGNLQWSQVLGGAGYDAGYAVQQTSDGGYMVAGYTWSIGQGDREFFMIKTDANGDTLWTKAYGDSNYDILFGVQQTTDGGYIAIGETWSFGQGGADMYLQKTDASGNLTWAKTYGAIDYDIGYSVQQTSDGGYILSGTKTHPDDFSFDILQIKTDANGTEEWVTTYRKPGDEFGRAVKECSDGGFITVGYTSSFGAGNFDVYLVKSDAFGNTGCNELSTAIIAATANPFVSAGVSVTTGGIISGTATMTDNPATIDSTLCLSNSISPVTSATTAFVMYPNPTTGRFTVGAKGPIRVFDMLGNLLLTEPVKREIDLSAYRSGIYFVNVGNNTRKLLLTR